MRRLFFDIETQANPEACALMPEPIIEAPANYKDPEKIAQYITEKTEAIRIAALEKAALDPDYGKVISIGMSWNLDSLYNPVVHMVGAPNLLTNGIWTEETIIRFFWDTLRTCDGYCVGYNILGFDLPYLLRRSMALGIKVPLMPNLAKFRTEPVTDLMMILYNWGSDKYKGLKQVAKLYGIPNDCPDVDGSKVKDLSPQQLRDYQTSDVNLVIQLYERMNGVYFSH